MLPQAALLFNWLYFPNKEANLLYIYKKKHLILRIALLKRLPTKLPKALTGKKQILRHHLVHEWQKPAQFQRTLVRHDT